MLLIRSMNSVVYFHGVITCYRYKPMLIVGGLRASWDTQNLDVKTASESSQSSKHCIDSSIIGVAGKSQNTSSLTLAPLPIISTDLALVSIQIRNPTVLPEASRQLLSAVSLWSQVPKSRLAHHCRICWKKVCIQSRRTRSQGINGVGLATLADLVLWPVTDLSSGRERNSAALRLAGKAAGSSASL
jgi:hypothetical protein